MSIWLWSIHFVIGMYKSWWCLVHCKRIQTYNKVNQQKWQLKKKPTYYCYQTKNFLCKYENYSKINLINCMSILWHYIHMAYFTWFVWIWNACAFLSCVYGMRVRANTCWWLQEVHNADTFVNVPLCVVLYYCIKVWKRWNRRVPGRCLPSFLPFLTYPPPPHLSYLISVTSSSLSALF